MSYMKKLLAIAPYEELNHSMRTVAQEFTELQADVFTADLEEGKKIALDLYRNDYDAIISRGGTADLIRQSVSIPVIDVSISIYDILGAIRLADNYTDNYVIVGYASITEPAHLLCDILGYNIKIVTLDKTSDTNEILTKLSHEHFEMILCDAITNRLALSKSLNTILITSGYESVKNAYKEAMTITQFLKKEKQEKLLLEAALHTQKQKTLLFDQHFHLHFSTLPDMLTASILHFLTTRYSLENEESYYYTSSDNVYHLCITHIHIDDDTYFNCNVTDATPPAVNHRFGITYKKRAEIEEISATNLLFTKFIREETRTELKKMTDYYNALLIWGEVGTAKTNIAYQAFLNQKTHTSHLITVDAKLINEKVWKFLLNPSTGPLVDDNNTILFKNAEQFSIEDTDKLITIVKNTKLLQRNHLLFTYNTKKGKDEAIYSHLHMNLNCGSLYVPSLKERKNELNAITTALLNKINIESNREILGFVPKALQEFLNYSWPGNFNQIQSALKELVINAKTHYISEHQVIQLIKKEQLIHNVSNHHTSAFSLPNTLEEPTLFDYNQYIILNVLEQNNGNQTKSAKQLGISRTTLWRYIKET